MWLDFVSTLENPWDPTNHIDVMQELWNRTFTDIDHTVQRANDPVYFLVGDAFFVEYNIALIFPS